MDHLSRELEWQCSGRNECNSFAGSDYDAITDFWESNGNQRGSPLYRRFHEYSFSFDWGKSREYVFGGRRFEP